MAIRGDLPLLNCPQKILEQRVRGGVEESGVGHHTCMPLLGGPLGEQGPLHILARGWGVETMVASAHHDEDLPLVEEDLIPPLHRALPQGLSRPNVQAVLGERATKVEMWQSDFSGSDGGRT